MKAKQSPILRAAVAELHKRRKAVGAERDRLREIVSTLSELEDSCTAAVDLLDEAIDKLSELA